ncbi:MAG TPA: magnesium transporter, partial [Prosthecobacter sp.]|nr:magnesium transporter [Prosthecobacter sp.]
MNELTRDQLLAEVTERAPHDAADLLEKQQEPDAVFVLEALNPMVAQQVLHEMSDERRCAVLAAAPI